MELIKAFQLLYGIQISHAIVEVCNNEVNDTLCSIEENYDKNMIPKPWPCFVQVGLFIQEIFDIDDNKDTISMSLELSMVWIDNRLDYVATMPL